MKRLIFSGFLAFVLLFIALSRPANAQMMGWGWQQSQNPPSHSDIQNEQNMQNAGQQIYQNLKSGKVACQGLTSSDYEKLGEYFMGQAAGSAENHVYWDNGIEQMMGEQGDTQMHIAWGERGSGCLASAAIPSNTPTFFQGMMGYYYPNQNQNPNGNNINNNQGGEYNMMWGYGGNFANFSGFGFFWIITWAVLFIDLVLLGIWLWKQVKKNK